MLKKFIFSAMFLLSFGNVLPAQTISVKEAAQLEIKIAQTPDDYDTRSKLLSYYQQGKTLADKKSLQKHRLGLIQNNPQKASYVILGVWVIEDKNKAEFIELKKEWLKQLSKFKTDSEVRLNAADFLSVPESEMAEKIYLEGETMDADFFWFPLRLLEFYNSKLDELELNSELYDKPVNEADRKLLLAKIVAQTQKGIAALEKQDTPTRNELTRKFLANQAVKSLELGDTKTANQAAVELSRNLIETKPQTGLYEYYRVAESVKGRVLLKVGNLAGAKERLFSSITSITDMEGLPPIVDVRFVEELLIKEGAENVLKYLKLCENLNLEEDDRATIKKWQNLLLRGKVPKFSEYSFTIEKILIL
jgi:hypothetical protein